MAEIPQDDTRTDPSVWAAGDVAHSHEEIAAESPGGGQAAADPNAQRIMELEAELAAAKAGNAGADEAPVIPPAGS
jgi:hypothetical protein